MVFGRRDWFESARKYFVIGQKSVLKNDGLFVFLLLLRGAVHFPFEQNIFAGTEAAAVQNYKFPLTFLIFHVFPAQNNMQKFLVKNLFSHSFIQNSNISQSERWKQ